MNKYVFRIIVLLTFLFYLSINDVSYADSTDVEVIDNINANIGLTPSNVTAFDKLNDAGSAISIEWEIGVEDDDKLSTVNEYIIFRSSTPETGFEFITSLPMGSTNFDDSNEALKNGESYYYKVGAVIQGDTLLGNIAGPAVPKPQFFHTKRLLVFIFMLMYAGTTIFFILHARKGKKLYVRPIAGIDAVDDAIGRATEMGKPILFVPGLGDASKVATIAAFTILGRVAKRVAEYQTRLIVPNYDPVVMTICQEVVKEAYSAAGRPDDYDSKDVYFVTQDQFPYTASVNGTMLREKPATNFYMGMFYAESLILAETGYVAGSIQIAGTDQLIQIPFFITACDYTLMGEELYAASAYLSQEPQQLGTLKAQDYGKVAALAIMFFGILAYMFGKDFGDMILNFVIGG